MVNKLPGNCPVCSNDLLITGLRCPDCNTSIKGEFHLEKLFQLNPEQLDFIKVFIKSRGNIKEVEKELGISYPTVRSKLDKVIQDLGYNVDESPDDNAIEKRKEILDSLEKGEIKTEEAVKLLKKT